jgi:uncharacterized protein YjdB
VNCKFKLSACRGPRIPAVALIGAMAACVEARTPTSSLGTAGFQATATQVSTAITHTLLTSGNNPVNQKVYTTAGISPAPNALITVAVLAHRATIGVDPPVGAPPSPTVSGAGMTWTEVATLTFDGPTPVKRLTIYRAMSAAPGSGPLTITFSPNVSNCQWIVSQWTGVETSGANGAGAIGQTGSTRGDGVSGLAVPLATFGNANNVAYGVFGVSSSTLAVTPGAGFTELSEQASGETAAGDLQAEGTPNDSTIDATWSTRNGGALAVEIKAGTTGPGVDALQSTVAASPAAIKAGSGTTAITVTVRDASGTPISRATVVLAATGSGNTLTPAGPTATDASGVATGSLTSTVAEPKILSATANGTAITQTYTVTVEPDAASALAFTVQPSNTAPGATITPAVQVDIRDQFGNRVTSAANNVTLAIGTNPSGGTLAGTPTLGAVGGVATFSDLSIAQTGTGYGLAASASGLTGATSNAFDIGAASVSAITHTLLTSGNNTVNQKVYATATISPAPNALVTVAVMGHNSTSAAPSPTLSGGGMTGWTEVATITFDPVATPHKRLTIFRAMSPSPGSGPITITFSGSQSNCQWIVSQWDGVDITGVNGAGAIGQPGSNRGDAVSGLTVTLAAFGRANNVAYGVFGVNKSVLAVTPGAGFTEIGEQPSAESPYSDLEAEWAKNRNTITATWTSLNAAALGVEIRAGNTGPVTVVSVDVTPASASVPVGGTEQLTATPKDAAGQPLTGRTVTWATDAPAVATVSAAGLVTGVGAGSATITATSEGKSGTASVTVTAGGQALVGEWSSVLPAPIVQLHVQLLPNGKVLSWGHDGDPLVWDPATRNFTAVPSPSPVFCGGHDFLPDGRLLVTGGEITSSHGLANTNIFDYRTTSWQAGPRMAQGRWYPTNTTLPNGEVLTIAGEDENGTTVSIPEVWDGTGWRRLTTASLVLPYYPRTFVAPDGRVFYAGAQQQSRYLDVTGTGSWINGPLRKFGERPYGPAVMYEPGKILYMAGGNPPTSTAEIIDLNQPSPEWTYTGSMAYARWNANATVLPTGEVLVTGGTRLGDRTDPAGATKAAELWNPATGRWTTLASNAVFRGYHSTSLLLPDGRVLHTGGGDCCRVPDNLNYELYSPPYLFWGARPIVTGATSGAVGYGQTLFVETPDGAGIAKVSLVRFGSVTHAFDQGQRLVPLSFSQAAGGLSVTLPASRTAVPPGPYMLFLVNGNGVPSVGRIMRVQ